MVCCSTSIAQNITVKRIDLPASFNRDLLQMTCDDDGFIWFANNQGVWRYDGSSVKLFDYKKLKLNQNTAPYLLYSYKQFLFFSFISGETHVYNKVTDQCNVYYFNSWITNINQQKNGDLLLTTRFGTGWQFTPAGVLNKKFDLSKCGGWSNGMALDKSALDSAGHVYLFLRQRIGLLQKDSIIWGPEVKVNDPDLSKPFDIVLTTAVTSKYLSAVYYNGEAIIYDKKTLSAVYVHKVHDFACAICNGDKLVFIPRNISRQTALQKSLFYDTQEVAFADFLHVYSIAFLPARNKYILCSTAGLIELTLHNDDGYKYEYQYKLVSFFHNKSIRSIYRRNDTLYVGTYSGFFYCTRDSIHYVNPDIIYAIKPAGDGLLLTATEGGSGYAVFNCATTKFYTVSQRVPSHDFYITALTADNGQWLSADYATLYSLKNKGNNWSTARLYIDSALQTIRQVKRVNGRLYVAAEDGFSSFDAQFRRKKIYPRQGSVRVYCMQETQDGFWLGTNGNGLVKIDSAGNVLQQIDYNDGLAGSFVYSLAATGKLLTAGTSNGVSIFNTASGMQPLTIQVNDSLNGQANEECNHSAIFVDTVLQQVIIGGVNGLCFVNGKDYIDYNGQQNKRLLLSYIKTGGHETLSSQPDIFAYSRPRIVLNPDDVNVSLKFACPADMDQTDGLFRIQGLDDKWRRIKLDQEVNLYALPPGSYTLEARLPSAISSKEWFSKTIIVEPAFYQTIWFKVLIAACVLYIAWLIWRLQVRKIEREHQLRAMIASDLHDDIGSTLNSISVYTEVASRQLQPESAKIKGLLDNMGLASRNMIDSMSDIVWTINPKNDNFENVLERMRFFAGELLSGKNILLDFEVDDRVKKAKPGMEVRKNIYLIYKEAINNAFKYSGATNVKVRLLKESQHLVMIIHDNGGGFPNNGNGNGGGNGLVNMKSRAKEIGGKLTITSSVETGTAVQLVLKIG